jgi:hypothetical protein
MGRRSDDARVTQAVIEAIHGANAGRAAITSVVSTEAPLGSPRGRLRRMAERPSLYE